MTNPAITLPDYKNPPPDGGGPLKWWGFFLSPYKGTIVAVLSVNLARQCFFRIMPLFLGILVGWAGDGTLQSDPMLAVWWIAFFTAAALGVFLALLYLIPTAGRVMDTISKQISLFGFRHYLGLSEKWHENRASGEKLQRLLKARDSSYSLMEETLWHVLQFPAIAAAVFISVSFLNAPWYYIVLFYAMVGCYIWVSYITGNWMRTRFAEFYKTQEDVVGGVYEFLISTSTVRFFNLRHHILEKAGTLEGINHESRMRLFRTAALRWLTINTNAISWIVLIIGLATYQVVHGTLDTAAYATLIFLTLTIWYEIENFAILYVRLIDYWEGFKRLTEILNLKPAITDAPDAADLDIREPAITFEDINFGYHTDAAVVENFSLNIRAGEKIGLIGPSGAGKSTIVKLLLRFYDLDRGRITIGGHDIGAITQFSLQNSIAVIPQDIVLFNHSLLENIRYGRLSASDEEVYEAARKAHAHEFIETLPDGYATLVGERGVKLSGGQRQRIAIARAILKDAPILLLDEATSALDSESEKLIQDSLKLLMEGKTVIAIAHRLSTISHLDRLVVMNGGQIIEDGPHDALLKRKGLYASLWSMQSGGFLGE